MYKLTRSLSFPLYKTKYEGELLLFPVKKQRFDAQHFCHRHPLIYSKVRKNGQKCYMCRHVGSDEPVYSCDRCDIFIHQSCFELPKHLSISLHPEHQLELGACNKTRSTVTCDSCCELVYSFRYSCRPCDSDTHVTCASPYIFRKPRGHEHSFINFLKPTMFTCDACGLDEKIKCLSCICTGCQLQVHKKCSYSFPHTVKQRQHGHALTLTYTYEIDFDISRKHCRICSRKMNSVLCFYKCNPCDYITHVRCATCDDVVADEEDNETVGNYHVLGRVKSAEFIRDASETMGSLHKHFDHRHFLSFSTDETDQFDAVCDGCTMPISAPFYKCVDAFGDNCDFILHKQCFELPEKIQNPLHNHPLALIGSPRKPYTTLHCIYCNVECNGFAYVCGICNVSMDVNCALLSDTLVHESHKCPLTLIDGRRKRIEEKTQCNACGLDSLFKFACEECNFEICLKCASLPKTPKHDCPKYDWGIPGKKKYDWGIRPLKLMFGAIKDASGIYFCDLCEEPRGENHWFYYCEDCKWSNHPQCVIGEDLIKFGRRRRISRHPHLFILSKKPRSDRTCHKCGGTFKGSFAYFCRECDIYAHVTCRGQDLN